MGDEFSKQGSCSLFLHKRSLCVFLTYKHRVSNRCCSVNENVGIKEPTYCSVKRYKRLNVNIVA